MRKSRLSYNDDDAPIGHVIVGYLDLLKDVAFDDGRATLSDFERMAIDVLPDVVDGMEDDSRAVTLEAGHVGTPARRVMHQVAKKGDSIVVSVKEHDPVVSVVARHRMICPAVKFRAGDGQSSGAPAARDDELSTNVGKLAMVDPDVVRLHEGDAVTTPNRFRIDARDVDILENDILCALDTESLALQDAPSPETEDGLVRIDVQGYQALRIVAYSLHL